MRWNLSLVGNLYEDNEGGPHSQGQIFAAHQEAVRKDVECAFGVLVARFHILKRPCLLPNREDIASVMLCCVILHNMIVDARRDKYARDMHGMALDAAVGDGEPVELEWQSRRALEFAVVDAPPGSWAGQMAAPAAEIWSQVGHFSLKKDLVDHVWSYHGTSLEEESK
jgi:Plant transposon protein